MRVRIEAGILLAAFAAAVHAPSVAAQPAGADSHAAVFVQSGCAVCHGDDGGGTSYYTKRSLLVAVWTSTYLCWLEDRSAHFADTFAFLERRIDNVMQLGRMRARLDDALKAVERLNPLGARR